MIDSRLSRLPVAAAVVFVLILAISVGIIVGRSRHAAESSGTEYVLLEGTLESAEVDVSAKIPGRISRMVVQEGDAVSAGQVVAFLESKEVAAKVSQASGMYNAACAQETQAVIGVDLQARTAASQVKQAEAGYRAAKAKLNMALSGARPQEVAQAKAAAEAAEAAYATAKSAYDRFHGLYQEGVIPKQQEEAVELQYRSAKSAKDAAAAKLDMVREGARKEDIEAAREGVRAAEAQLKMARDAALQVNLRQQDVQAAGWKASAAKGQLDEAEAYMSETKIISPISGYVSECMSDSGEMVSAGFPIITIVKGRDFKVKVYADESRFGYLKLGDPVTVIVPALAGREFKGKIIRVSPAADFAVKKATNEQGSFDVRSLQLVVKLVDAAPEFRNGMTARVKLAAAKR